MSRFEEEDSFVRRVLDNPRWSMVKASVRQLREKLEVRGDSLSFWKWITREMTKGYMYCPNILFDREE